MTIISVPKIKKKKVLKTIFYIVRREIFTAQRLLSYLPPIQLSILPTVVRSKIRFSFCSGSAFNRFCVLFKSNKGDRGWRGGEQSNNTVEHHAVRVGNKIFKI